MAASVAAEDPSSGDARWCLSHDPYANHWFEKRLGSG
jgi:hypothetical protein